MLLKVVDAAFYAMSVTDVYDPRDTIDDVGACDNSAVDVCDDIGLLLRSMLIYCLKNIYLLNNHFKPDSNFKFPNRYLDGCNSTSAQIFDR